MNTVTTVCPAGYAPALIAAYHDQALDADKSAAIRQHVAECQICSTWLTEHAKVDAALRAQRVPSPDARLWTNVRYASGGAAHRPRGAKTLRRTLSGAGALVAVLLIALGFAQALHPRASTTQRRVTLATSTATRPAGTVVTLQAPPTATQPVAGAAVHVHPVAVPFALTDADAGSISVSPQDGNTAYLCYGHNQSPQTTVAAWVTHDLGASWTPITPLPDTGKINIGQCAVWADALDPSILGAFDSAQDLDTLDEYAHMYVSRDRGAHWTLVPDTIALYGMATVGSRTYAIRTTGTGFGYSTGENLSVSTDGLATWQPIDQQFTAQREFVSQFWARADNGTLLAAVSPAITSRGPSPAQTLWESTDGGRHWTRLSAPATPYFVAQAPAAGQPWHVCGYGPDPSSSQGSVMLGCSTDGGSTWTALSASILLTQCAGSACQEQALLYSPTATLASDGSLLVLFNGSDLYRLPAGSTQWQYLGSMPGNAGLYAPTAHGGAFWSYGGGGLYGYPSGTLGRTANGSGISASDIQP